MCKFLRAAALLVPFLCRQAGSRVWGSGFRVGKESGFSIGENTGFRVWGFLRSLKTASEIRHKRFRRRHIQAEARQLRACVCHSRSEIMDSNRECACLQVKTRDPDKDLDFVLQMVPELLHEVHFC